MGDFREIRAQLRDRKLSPREQAVIQGIAFGCTYEELGRQMFISRDTAKTHVSRALGKLGAVNSSHAVAIALRRGLIA